MKTYFLTGGLGFIGYHLAKRLLKDKNNVIIFDIQKHYLPLNISSWPYYSEYRVDDLKHTGEENGMQLTIIRGDCLDAKWLRESLEKARPEVIVHLAALSIAGICSDNPSEARLNIVDNTMVILDVLKDVSFPFERFVYLSSSMVYGNFRRDYDGQIIPAAEDQPCNPIDVYGTLKLSSELLIKVYNYRFAIPYTIIRPSAVYGLTDCNRRVTEIFLTNALMGKELLLDNKGTHQLDFTYIDDLIEGLTLALNNKSTLNDTFNISGGKGWSINQLADIVCELVPDTKIRRVDAVPFRPNRGAQDISKANRVFGYTPHFGLRDGLKAYLGALKSVNNMK